MRRETNSPTPVVTDLTKSDSSESAPLLEPEHLGADDSLSSFPPEDQSVVGRLNDAPWLRDEDERHHLDADLPLALEARTVDWSHDRHHLNAPESAETVGAIEATFNALDVVRDLARTVNERFVALKQLEHDIAVRAKVLTSQQKTIGQSMTAADEVARLVKSWETGLASLTERERGLRISEQLIAEFEQRATNAAASLDRRLMDFDTQQRSIAEHVARLQEHAAAASADLKQRFDAQKNAADTALGEVTRVTSLLTALEARITHFAGGGQALEHAERKVAALEHRATETVEGLERRLTDFGELEQRAANATAGLDRRLMDFDTQQRSIAEHATRLQEYAAAASADLEQRLDAQKSTADTALGEVTRITDLVSTLEARIAHFAGDRHQLEHVDRKVAELEQRLTDLDARRGGIDQTADHVGRLELRAAAATTELKQATEVKRTLEHGLANLQEELKRLRRAAQNDARQVVALNKTVARARPPKALDPRAMAIVVAGSLARAVQTTWQASVRHRLIAASIVAVLLIGVIATGGISRSTRSANQVTSDSRVLLASRSLSFAPLPAPAIVLPTAALGERSSTAAVQVPARPAVDVDASAVSPQAIGTLAVESEPQGASVFINQRSAGETPVLLTDLRPGSYVVRIERNGYQRWTTSVTVSAIRQTRLTARLQPDNPR